MPDIRISTITQIGNLSSNINLKELYNSIDISPQIKYIEYGDMIPKGISNKKKKKKIIEPKGKRKKYFYNQVSLQIYIGKIVNLKLFNNGAFQMTGLKSDEMGLKVIQIFIDIINSHNYRDNIIENKLTLLHRKIVLINSDFDIGFKINNPVLHRLMIDNDYYSSYESCIYPGVNIKYYYNKSATHDFGKCSCSNPCDGKGNNENCKKITVAVFNSGKIIITGGQSIEHIQIAKDFIIDFIHKHKREIMLNYNKNIIYIQSLWRGKLIRKLINTK